MPVETIVGNDAAYGSNYGPMVGGLGALPLTPSQSLGTAPSLAAFQAKPPSVAGSGTLPTLGAGPTGGLDMGGIQELMNSILPQSARVTPEEFKAAMTPIAQKGPVATPSAFGYRTPNPPPVQMMSGAVGAGAARGQGISNAVSATVGALAQFKATRDQRRQEADATKVSRLVEAQNAIGQAQQVLAADPSNAAAKKAVEDNNNIIQGMFQDPKFVKTVEKGFQISLTDPSQNKTPDHNIVQRGLDMFKQRSGQQQPTAEQMRSMAQQAQQRFSAAQPTQMAQNVQAQQQVQMKMAQQKAAEDYVKAFSPMMVQASKFQQAQILQHAQQAFTASQDLYKAGQARYLAAEKYNQASTLAQYQAEKAFALEGMREAGRLNYLAKAVASKYDNPLAQQQLIDTANNQWDQQKVALNGRIDTLQGQYNSLIKEPSYGNMKKGDPIYDQAQSIKQQIEGLKTGFSTLDEQHNKAMDSIGAIIRGGKPDAGQSPTGVPTGAAGPGPSGVPSPTGGVAGVADAAIAAEGAAEARDITYDPASTDYSSYVFNQ